MTRIKGKRIQIASKDIERLAKVYNTTSTTVYNALSYKTRSLMAEKIRKDALEVYGGINVTTYTMY